MKILKIIEIFVLAGWVFMKIVVRDEGKTIREKSLTKEEKRYLDRLEMFAIITSLYIIGEIWGTYDLM